MSLEQQVIALLDAVGVRYERAPRFDVTLADRRQVVYRVNLLLPEVRARGRQVVIDVLEEATPWGGVRRMVAFKRAWGATHYLLVVAAPAAAAGLSPESYHQLIVADDLEAVLPALLRQASTGDAT